MRVFPGAWDRGDLPSPTVGTIGNYDGVHLGQRAVLERVVERARETGHAATVISFEPHPRRVLDPEHRVPALTTGEQKAELLDAAGIDALVIVDFTPEVAATPAEAFVTRFLVGRLGMCEVFVGRGFAFGRERRGNLELLRRVGADHGLTAEGVAEVEVGGERVSSTRIREAIAGGRVDEARRLLGRPYALRGDVVQGAGRGRTLGWPTANLEVVNELLPLDGVYAAGLELRGGGGVMPGVANVGLRPTVDSGATRTVEIHLFDFAGDLYGRPVELLLCRRLRNERRFGSLDELRVQIGLDARRAREYFSRRSCWSQGGDAAG